MQNSLQLLDDKYRTMVITKGFAQSSKFSWDITIQKYIEFYKELYKKIIICSVQMFRKEILI